MRRCLTKSSWIFEFGAVQKFTDDACQKLFSWFSDWIQKVQKCVNLDLENDDNEWLVEKIGFDTAENGPSKVWITDSADYIFRPRNERLVPSAWGASVGWEVGTVRRCPRQHRYFVALDRAKNTGLVLGCIEAKFWKKILNMCLKALAEIYTMHLSRIPR